LCIAIILSGVVVNTILQGSLNAAVDDNLRVYSARVHGTLDTEEIPEPLDYEVIHSSLPPINEFTSPGLYIQLIDTNGNVVVKSSNLGEQEFPMDPSLVERGFEGETSIDTISTSDGAMVRLMVSPLFLQDEVLLLEVGQSLNNVDATMSQVRWAILGGVFVTLVLVGISGGVIVRRALSPVEQITRTAQSIESSSDLNRRVGYTGPTDEIGRLATTFDHMIEHLHRVFESQKHFIADASHDLRGPLTVIRGNLDLLKRNMGEQERQESLREMEAETIRMEKMVNDLLLLAKVESGQTDRQEAVSLKAILVDGFEWGQQQSGNHYIVKGKWEDLVVNGDSEKLTRMIVNLIDNAIKYTPEGSTITLSLFRDGDWACLEVADNGVGIAPEHLPHIFDRFYRTDKARSRKRGGTGLGLAIVKGIAEQHGGDVSVTSSPDKGSIFTVWLKVLESSR
jgi:signal transduction histidine kinase